MAMYDEGGNVIDAPTSKPVSKQAPLVIPKSLQKSLNTTPSPVKANSIIPAQTNEQKPVVQPQASAIPTPEQMTNDQGFVQGMSRATPNDIPQLRAEQLALGQASAKEEAQAKIDQSQTLARGEKSRTELMQDMAKQQAAAIEQHKKDIEESSPFAPTKESAKDVASLFALISVAAFGSGGQGKYAGMRTLASLTGAMKGYQEGRKDVYEKDIKAFEENLKVIKSHNDKINALYEDSMKLMSTNKDLALQKIQEIISTDNTGIISRLARSGQYKQLGEAVGAVSASLTAAQDKIDKLNNEFALLAKRFQNEKDLVGIREAATLARFREEKKYEKPEVLFNEAGKPFYIDTLTKKVVPLEGGMEGMRKTQAKPTGQLGPTAFLKDIIGKTSGSDKGDQKIVDLARGVSEMDHVITLFRDPSVKTGVLSKLSGIREKLASLGKGDPNHEITDDEFQRIVDGEISSSAKNAVAQKEALFAAYTAEREIAGGRLLVSVIKQAGGALDPTNYEKEGYLNLLASRKNQLVKGLRGAHLTDNEIQSVIDGVNKSTLTPSATQPVAESKQKATPEEIKAYADEHFKGNQDAAKADLKAKGFL